MPRKLRFYLSNVPAHVIQRGHNREPVFFEEQDYLEYLKILKRVADACHCAIHAYVMRCRAHGRSIGTDQNLHAVRDTDGE